jgi:hypothetical protein
MAYTTIDDPSKYFNTILYTGNNAANRSITGAGLQPDWGWLKQRNGTGFHELYDSSRGVTKALSSNTSDAEATTSALDSFDSDGITVSFDSNNSASNGNGKTAVWWLWKANGGTTSSNTNGSITSTVQANTTAGFSIVTYTGTGSNATVGHGLGVAPKVVIIKNRDSSASWMTYHEGVDASNPADFYLFLNTTGARVDDATAFQDTEPTSTVFSIGNGTTQNQSSANIVAYCFAEIQGYSKFGTYTGNGNADGPFVYTGFKPAWLMIHRTDSAGENWQMFDNKRDGFNNGSSSNKMLKANVSETEDTNSTGFLDLVSNGFKIRESAARHNASGGTYIYMAFAEHPFVSSKGVPVTAR